VLGLLVLEYLVIGPWAKRSKKVVVC